MPELCLVGQSISIHKITRTSTLAEVSYKLTIQCQIWESRSPHIEYLLQWALNMTIAFLSRKAFLLETAQCLNDDARIDERM